MIMNGTDPVVGHVMYRTFVVRTFHFVVNGPRFAIDDTMVNQDEPLKPVQAAQKDSMAGRMVMQFKGSGTGLQV